MANLQCSVRNPGCLKKARFVCHHCGRPLCSHCDKEITDRQFAKLAGTKKQYPKAHHCPNCYHPPQVRTFLHKTANLVWWKQFLRQFFT